MRDTNKTQAAAALQARSASAGFLRCAIAKNPALALRACFRIPRGGSSALAPDARWLADGRDGGGRLDFALNARRGKWIVVGQLQTARLELHQGRTYEHE